MTLSISISPEAEARLREKAAANGQALDAYVSSWLERAAAAPSVEDVLKPFRDQVAESGMDDAELDAFLDDVREKAFQDRQRRRPA